MHQSLIMRIDFNTTNASRPRGMDFLIHWSITKIWKIFENSSHMPLRFTSTLKIQSRRKIIWIHLILFHIAISTFAFSRWGPVFSRQEEVKPYRWSFKTFLGLRNCIKSSMLCNLISGTVPRFSPPRCRRATEGTSRLALNRSPSPPWSTSPSDTGEQPVEHLRFRLFQAH